MAKLSAVIIKGNPKYIDNNPLATQYYQAVETYLKQLGVNDIAYDAGADYTCPRKDADLYIAHSRGCSRIRCFEDLKDPAPFVMLGDARGVIHPKDAHWQAHVWTSDTAALPPHEHYEFFSEQRAAVKQAVEAACRRSPISHSKTWKW